MDTVILKRLLLFAGAGISCALMVVMSLPGVRARLGRWERPLQVAVYLLSRPLLFLFLYVAMGVEDRGSDLSTVYYPQADEILSGKIPGKDMWTQYSPVYPYILALSYLPFPEDFRAAPVLLFIVMDFLTMMMMRSMVRDLFDKDGAEVATWLFMLSPLTWIVSVHYGQDEIATAVFIMLGIYLVHKNRSLLAGASLGFAIMATKYTTAIAALCYVLRKRGGFRFREVGAVAAPIILIWAAFTAVGSDLIGLLRHTQGFTAVVGGNSYVSLIFGALKLEYTDSTVGILTVISMISAVIALGVGRMRQLPFNDLTAVCFIVFFLTLFGSVCLYRNWILAPVIIWAIGSRRIALVAVWSFLQALLPTTAQGQSAFWLMYGWTAANVVVETLLVWRMLRERGAIDSARPRA